MSALAVRPAALMVTCLPAAPTSGDVFRRATVAAGVEAAAIGPGSGATPGTVGGGTGPALPKAAAGTSSAPTTASAKTTRFAARCLSLLVFIVVPLRVVVTGRSSPC